MGESMQRNALNRSDFPPGAIGQCLETCVVVQLCVCVCMRARAHAHWFLVGTSQECHETSYNTQDSPTTKNHLTPNIKVLRVGTPDVKHARHRGKDQYKVAVVIILNFCSRPASAPSLPFFPV